MPLVGILFFLKAPNELYKEVRKSPQRPGTGVWATPGSFLKEKPIITKSKGGKKMRSLKFMSTVVVLSLLLTLPAATGAAPPVQEEESEWALCRAKYWAIWCKDPMTDEGVVIVVAWGTHLTSGYQVFFDGRHFPEITFSHIAPTGHVFRVITPFAVWDRFEVPEPDRSITVYDADGEHTIPVEPMEECPSCPG